MLQETPGQGPGAGGWEPPRRWSVRLDGFLLGVPVIVALVLAIGLVIVPFARAQAEAISVTPAGVAAGGTATVTGSDWYISESVVITWLSTGAFLGNGIPSDGGDFTLEILVPADAEPDFHWVHAQGTGGEASQFRVRVNAPDGDDTTTTAPPPSSTTSLQPTTSTTDPSTTTTTRVRPTSTTSGSTTTGPTTTGPTTTGPTTTGPTNTEPTTTGPTTTSTTVVTTTPGVATTPAPRITTTTTTTAPEIEVLADGVDAETPAVEVATGRVPVSVQVTGSEVAEEPIGGVSVASFEVSPSADQPDIINVFVTFADDIDPRARVGFIINDRRIPGELGIEPGAERSYRLRLPSEGISVIELVVLGREADPLAAATVEYRLADEEGGLTTGTVAIGAALMLLLLAVGLRRRPAGPAGPSGPPHTPVVPAASAVAGSAAESLEAGATAALPPPPPAD